MTWNKPHHALGLLAVLLAVTAGPAFSSPITIVNSSFEMHDPFNRPCISTNCYDITDPIGWTRANGPFQGQFAPDSTYFLTLPLADGSVVAYSNGGSLYQVLGQGAAANTGYLLQVSLGRRFDCCNGLPKMIPGIPDTPSVMDIELRAGGIKLPYVQQVFPHHVPKIGLQRGVINQPRRRRIGAHQQSRGNVAATGVLRP